MALTLNEQIDVLKTKVAELETKIIDLTDNLENKRDKPETLIDRLDKALLMPIGEAATGLGQLHGGAVVWNDEDLKIHPYGQKPSEPTKGYNKHFHSRFAGGALDINTLELVEFDFDPSKHNPNCQQLFKVQPNIKKDDNGIEKISSIVDNMVWDKENKIWRFLAVYAEDE